MQEAAFGWSNASNLLMAYCEIDASHSWFVKSDQLQEAALAFAPWLLVVTWSTCGYLKYFIFLQIMIYLIDKVLPDSYFVNNLRALSVDMAVFRDLLRMKLPELSQHLDTLQRAANRESGGRLKRKCCEIPSCYCFIGAQI